MMNTKAGLKAGRKENKGVAKNARQSQKAGLKDARQKMKAAGATKGELKNMTAQSRAARGATTRMAKDANKMTTAASRAGRAKTALGSGPKAPAGKKPGDTPAGYKKGGKVMKGKVCAKCGGKM